MKKILLVFAFFTVALTVNAQFTTYQSINPNVPQQRSVQGNSGAPFTTYQPSTRIKQNNVTQPQGGTRLQQMQKVIRCVYFNTIVNEAQYIKVKVVDDGIKQYAKAYYDAQTDQWFKCNSEIKALGIYDDAELREYFSYKFSIPNLGVIYF